MPIFSGAIWKPISGPSGAHLGGPAKIVHHTTEGPTAAGAFTAFRANRSDPHFTVDETTIYQHIDTDMGARALRNAPGGVQTNRDGAIQIEVVGFAHRPKSKATLRNLARLCRWIEAAHGVPKVWPNGPPKPATPAGKDPGGHNRNAANWDGKGGHYGHSQVPENTHWDPGYTADEVAFLMSWTGAEMPAPRAFRSIPETDPGLAGDQTQMPDHAHVDGAPPPRAAGGAEGVVARRGREALDRAERAIRSGRIDPGRFGFAPGSVSSAAPDLDRMLESNPVGLEAIILATGRPSLLVRDGRIAFEPVDGLERFTQEVADRADALVGSVGRVEFLNHHHQWAGTGFIVEEAPLNRRVVATNRHVAALVARRAADGRGIFMRAASGLRYGARLDMREEVGMAPGPEYELPVTDVRYLADDTEADLALLEIAVHDGLAPPAIPLAERRAAEGDLVAVIGYPARDARNDARAMQRYFGEIFGVKRFAPGLVTGARPGEDLTYDCTTLGGNSGSCLLNLDLGTVLGVHYWGEEGLANKAVGIDTLKRVLAGLRPVVAAAGLTGLEAAGDGAHGAADLAGRNGYDAGFLGPDLHVPLPGMSADLQSDLARPSDSRDRNDFQLRYRNFGILFSQSRRMARLTAVNIDGGNPVKIKREEPDRWFADLRIGAELQLQSDAYADAEIDRGHLVRREDPNWGAAARQANDDTFHFTNAAPQHKDLNRLDAFWAGLEKYILDSARTHGFRATVFTGPVLRDDDPPVGAVGTGVPREFWKVVVMARAGGGLHATGYVLSQGHMFADLQQARNNLESIAGFQFGPYRAYQVAIRHIEEVTGLSFDALRGADPMEQAADGAEAAAAGSVVYRPLGDLGDVVLGAPPDPVDDGLARLADKVARHDGGSLLPRLTALQDILDPEADYPDDLRRLFDDYHRAVRTERVREEAPAITFDALKGEYAAMLASCRVRPERAGEVSWIVGRLRANKPRYAKVGTDLGIPWWFVGITHALEASFNFGTHLHNGDPLSARTVQVPKGRPKAGTPPFQWEASAMDAMRYKGYAGQADWSAPRALFRFEAYNGWGYRMRGLPSPYLWSFSQHYVRGKFVKDGKYDPAALSRQCGAGVLMRELGVAG